MNREILFRGKRVDNGEWVEGVPVKVKTGKRKEKAFIISAEFKSYDIFYDYLETSTFEVIPSTVGRYTGLTDKNGRRIFEGDILDLTPYMIKDVGVVRFGEYKDLDMGNDYPCGHVGFYVDVEKRRNSARKDILFFVSECKVIGNIHDAPELMGGSTICRDTK